MIGCLLIVALIVCALSFGAWPVLGWVLIALVVLWLLSL